MPPTPEEGPAPPRHGALWTRRTRAAYAAAALAALVAVGLAAGGQESPRPTVVPGALPPPTLPAGALPPPAAPPPDATAQIAVGAAPAGGRRVVWGERRTGVVRAAVAGAVLDGVLSGAVVARVPIGPGGRRGVGLLPDGTVVVARTRPTDDRLVLERLDDARRRTLLLRGPAPRPGRRTDAFGGAVTVTAGGRVEVAVGDLDDPVRAARPGSRAGRVLRVAADRRTRRPEVLSGGWQDPRALHRAPDGRLWIADRARPGVPERVARADRDDRTRLPLRVLTAPTGLATLPSGSLLACGEATGRLQAYRLGPFLAGPPRLLRGRCRYGVAVDGRTVLVGAGDGRVIARPVERVLGR